MAKKADAVEETLVKKTKEAKVKTPKAAPKKASPKTPKAAILAHGVGRRKSAVARVWLTKGSGKVVVNNLDHTSYFDTPEMCLEALKPFGVIPQASVYDVKAIVTGGGKSGQADALKVGIARSLVIYDDSLRSELRKYGLLTIDSRVVERKKPGQKKARRKFQFVKR